MPKSDHSDGSTNKKPYLLSSDIRSHFSVKGKTTSLFSSAKPVSPLLTGFRGRDNSESSGSTQPRANNSEQLYTIAYQSDSGASSTASPGVKILRTSTTNRSASMLKAIGSKVAGVGDAAASLLLPKEAAPASVGEAAASSTTTGGAVGGIVPLP